VLSLGIKIGSELFVAATSPQAGQRSKVDAIRRQAVLFWMPGQQPELRPMGSLPQSPTEVEIGGFVDRVGDSVEVVASDGSPHRAEDLVAAAVAFLLRYMAGAFDRAPAIAVSYPSHWEADTLNAFERSVDRMRLSVPSRVPECRAILARARDMRGVPSEGILAVYDLGGNGLSITMAQAGAWEPVGRTLRDTDFGVTQADYSILRHVLNLVEDDTGDLNYEDSAAVRQLGVLRDKCRIAKETLSTETATIIDVELGRFRDGIRLVRSELEEMIREPIQRSADLVRESLAANNVDARSLSGIVLAGGGASIPLVTEFLSSEFGVPVVRDQDPGLTSALGAMIVEPAPAATTARGGVIPPPARAEAAQSTSVPAVATLPADPSDRPNPQRHPHQALPPKVPSPAPVATKPESPGRPATFTNVQFPPPPPPPPARWSQSKDSPSHPEPSRRHMGVAVAVIVAGLLALVGLGAVMFSEPHGENVNTGNTPTTTTVTTVSTSPTTITTTSTTTSTAKSNPCATNPSAAECGSTKTDRCKANPTAPGCPTNPEACKANPTAPGCPTNPEACKANPTGPGCPAKTDACKANPTGPGCPAKTDACKANPTAPGCPTNPEACKANPTDPKCATPQGYSPESPSTAKPAAFRSPAPAHPSAGANPAASKPTPTNNMEVPR
jgi:hypothetical protein